MEFKEFERQARADGQVLELARDIAEQYAEMEGEDATEKSYGLGAESALIGLSILALYRWSNIALNGWRDNIDTDVAERRVQLVGDLVKQGLPPDKAAEVAESLLTQIGKRAGDDGAIQKLMGFLDQFKK